MITAIIAIAASAVFFFCLWQETRIERAILNVIPPEGATHEEISTLSGYDPETVWCVLCELHAAGVVFSLAPYWHRTNLPGGSNHA